MPNIDFNEFKKQNEEKSPEERTISEVQTKDRQFYIKEEGVVFDIIDLDFEGKGPGMEVLMSLVGEGFKMRCDLVPKEIFESYDIPDYLMSLVDEYKPCLKCKSKFLDEFCSSHKDDGDIIEFLSDDDDEEA